MNKEIIRSKAKLVDALHKLLDKSIFRIVRIATPGAYRPPPHTKTPGRRSFFFAVKIRAI